MATRSRTGCNTNGCESTNNTEQLITKVCATFTSQLEEKFDVKFEKIHDRLSEMSRALGTLRSDCIENTKKIQNLEPKVDHLEQLQKRRSVRILGLSEAENENPVETLIDFLGEYLNVSCESRDVDAVFRVKGTERNSGPRVLLVIFTTLLLKQSVMSANKAKLKGSKILVYEDLSKEAYQLLRLTKEKYGPRNVWSSSGKVFVKCGDTKNCISILDDIV
ncbi:unnamed protein product [Acanthoscelides obtectus]|uniref:Zinc finger DNA binding protein n=1 Tax=Acanthoscelides obtectus TaxID=200917 RepID=A0A9P0LV70_ACAOB|nr:unnamed protein product [Acanthoscelides obtectus]CAK1627564.1 hypothetical protein AOBTE_LOCUS4663 [Acanthoscelides obtectus]